MKHEHQIKLGKDGIGVVRGTTFCFDQFTPHEILIEPEALEQAVKLGALMIETDSATTPGKRYCCMTFFRRVAKTVGEFLAVDVDHFCDSPADAHEYAMRMEREERR